MISRLCRTHLQGRKSAEHPPFLRTTEVFGYLFCSGSSGLGKLLRNQYGWYVSLKVSMPALGIRICIPAREHWKKKRAGPICLDKISAEISGALRG
jgi:hypothetical protein